MTTLGVIGLGRIGAFHTETLSGLDGLDGLVITDERTDVAAAVAAKHGAKAVDTVEELLSSGIDGVVVVGRNARARRADTGRRRAWHPDVLREAHRLDGG